MSKKSKQVEELRHLLSLKSVDWALNAIVEALSHKFDVTFQVVRSGLYVNNIQKRTSPFEYEKGSSTDKSVKKVAEFFFENEGYLRDFVAFLDDQFGRIKKKEDVFVSISSYDKSELVVWVDDKDVVFRSITKECLAIAGEGKLRNSLALLLAIQVAQRYHYDLKTETCERIKMNLENGTKVRSLRIVAKKIQH